jgi:glycyl-tRNA synthetase beta chain
MQTTRPQVDAAFAKGDFAGALKAGAAAPERRRLLQRRDGHGRGRALRNNRLALLASLHGMMNRVADISKLAA